MMMMMQGKKLTPLLQLQRAANRIGSTATKALLATKPAAAGAAAAPIPKVKYDVEKLHEVNYYQVPSLPLPPLKQTLTRYLETIEPLCFKEELMQTTKYAQDFLKSDVAKTLQQDLEKVANSRDVYPFSYIEKWWDEMYYGGRWPLMVHVNPFFLFRDDASLTNTQRVAKFSVSATKWWRKVVEGRLEPDMEGGKPLCGYQYGQVFGVERVPSLTRDGLVRHPHSKHIVVVHKGLFFKVTLVTDDGKVISVDALAKQLDRIVSSNASRVHVVKQDVGVLTSTGRAEYYKGRQAIEKVTPANKASFREIDTCLFVVVLDHENYSKDLNKRSSMMLHGLNGSNRWWDKHQVIVSNDGVMGMSFEHGCNDGMTWARMCEEAFADMTGDKKPRFSPLGITELEKTKTIAPVQNLEFKINSEAEGHIKEALKAGEDLANDVDTHVLTFKDFGRNEIKNWKVSPDAVAQMSFQLANRRLNGKDAATYEAAAMKLWYHGRTETIRSCTTESAAMCDVFTSLTGNDESSKSKKREALQKACKKHGEIAVGARNAGSDNNLGVDRHLRALKSLAADKGLPTPTLFSDPVYERSTTWVLSTSNVTSPLYEIFGFGAVCGKGYGFGYMTSPDSIPINITSFRSGQADPSKTGSKAMAMEVAKALKDFQKVFPATGASSKKQK